MEACPRAVSVAFGAKVLDIRTSRLFLLVTLRASCGTVYCNQSCLFVGGWVCLCVGWSVTTITQKIAFIDPHQTEFIGKGSDHLQLIKFWPSRPRGGGLRRGENFWLHLTTASVQCLRLL